MGTRTPTLQQQAGAPVSVFEKREELRRILETKHFAAAPKKTRFMEFVTEQTLLGNGDKLNEYLIGVEVYDRGTDFDSQKDPIVRVQAHEIRRLLKKYYEEEGKDSPFRVDLPSGHYVPVFSRVSAEIPAEILEPVVVLAQSEPKKFTGLHLATFLLATACLVLAVLLFLRSGRPNSPVTTRAALPQELAWFWQPFLPPAAAPLIIIPNHPLLRAAHDGDSAQTLAGGHEIPKTDLPEFRDTIHFRELKRFRFVSSLTDFTSVGETLGLLNLYQMFSAVDQKCRVEQSRLATIEEIKHENVILLGGNQAWSGRVFLNTEGFRFQSGVILNNSPKPGEQPIYKPEFDSVTNQLTRDYALILLLPNERKENRVLLIYGIYTQGSQAAIEYITNPERMAELHKALLEISPDHKNVPQYFQVLLSARVENAMPGATSLIAVRTISN